jgi:type IV pilus assembly protein PilW
MAMRFETNVLNRMRGLSLVELMVAITIGAILLGGAVTLFVNNRDTYKTTNELSRLQETARYALDMMVKDIRMSGYFGCADRLDTVAVNVPVATDGELWDFNLDPASTIVPPIEGMEAAASADGFQPSGYAVIVGNDGDAGEIIAGTDAITIRYIAGSMADVNPANGTLDFQVTADAISGANSVITTDSTTGFFQDQIAVISDCGGSDIFQVNAAPTATTVQANSLSRAYNATSLPLIAPYVGVRYYIGDNDRGPGGAVYPALYRAVATFTGGALDEDYQELFEGVEQMQILYGVDDNSDGVPDSYVRAGDNPLSTGDPGTNWSNVVSVRIALVVRTVDEHGRSGDVDTNTYIVNDHDGVLRPVFDPADDRRRRRVFTTTAVVRNLS